MAVVSVDERFQDRGGRESFDGTKIVRTYTRSWIVITDSALDGPKVAITAVKAQASIDLLSTYASGNDADTGAFLVEFSHEIHEDNPTTCLVTATFTSDIPSDTVGGDPTTRDPEVHWSFQQHQKVAEKTIEYIPDDELNELDPEEEPSVPVVNSAGQPFDPPAEIDDSRPVLVFTKVFSVFNVSQAIAYQDAINNDIFTLGNLVVLRRQAKIANITADAFFEQGTRYWNVTVEIHFRRETWVLEILDRGRSVVSQITPTGNITNVKEIIDEEGNLTADPVKLNGAGQLLAEGAPPVYLPFHVYKELPFAALNIVLP